jgi:hypothetical protein
MEPGTVLGAGLHAVSLSPVTLDRIQTLVRSRHRQATRWVGFRP